ncbi:MAG: NifB/NifX family molybdenum-iron cluster-binding protein [Oscillospiraceae bacterium]|nr:NifB/NifX family molybdenum-iron cluster-binding protein [Oscillospiraceae bacterium]
MIMKIAVTYENGMVFQHFGRTQQFKVYEVADGKVTGIRVVGSNGSGHGALAGVLNGLGVDVLICGGMGQGAKNALAAAGIEVRGGVQGDADLAVADYLAGKLAFDPDYKCDHHDHHHGDDHECGDHGCGEHDCGDHDCHH